MDAVIVATPDHWHAPVALAAMDKGKDVYCEKPMCHTIEQAKQLAAKVHEKKRVMQVGSQTTSADQWHKAKKYIADGAIGKMIMSQGSYHRNSIEGEWNGSGWPSIPRPARPARATITSTGRCGSARAGTDLRRRPLLPLPQILGLFGRHRHRPVLPRGGAAEHLLAGTAVPARVSALGGIWEFKDEREVPDTFNLIADFPQGHSLVLLLHGQSPHPGLIAATRAPSSWWTTASSSA